MSSLEIANEYSTYQPIIFEEVYVQSPDEKFISRVKKSSELLPEKIDGTAAQ